MNYEDRITKEYMENAVGDGLRVAMGSYVGNGSDKVEYSISLTFGFPPKLVMVLCEGASNANAVGCCFFFRGMQYGIVVRSGSSYLKLPHATWTGNTLSWYNGNTGLDGMNGKDVTYQYLALG